MNWRPASAGTSNQHRTPWWRERLRRRRASPSRGWPAGVDRRPPGGDLDHVAVGITHVDRVERPAVEDLAAGDPAGPEVVAPRLLLAARLDAEREVVRGADPDDAVGHEAVLHEAHERPVPAVEPD